MQIELSPQETSELVTALGVHLDEMEREISRTEDRNYRKELRRTIDALDSIRRKLELRQDEAQVYA